MNRGRQKRRRRERHLRSRRRTTDEEETETNTGRSSKEKTGTKGKRKRPLEAKNKRKEEGTKKIKEMLNGFGRRDKIMRTPGEINKRERDKQEKISDGTKEREGREEDEKRGGGKDRTEEEEPSRTIELLKENYKKEILEIKKDFLEIKKDIEKKQKDLEKKQEDFEKKQEDWLLEKKIMQIRIETLEGKMKEMEPKTKGERIKDQIIQRDWNKINKSKYCTDYKEIKTEWTQEKYWGDKEIKWKNKEQWARMRCGNIEKAGNKEYENEECRLCGADAENLEHAWSCKELERRAGAELARKVKTEIGKAIKDIRLRTSYSKMSKTSLPGWIHPCVVLFGCLDFYRMG